MGCVDCPRKVEEDLEEYFCGYCQKTFSIAKAKYRVKLDMQDDSGEAVFAILDREGLRFFGVEADVLFLANQRKKEPIPPQIQQVINMKLKLHVKLTEYNFMNPQVEYFVVIVLQDPLEQVSDKSSQPPKSTVPIAEVNFQTVSHDNTPQELASQIEEKACNTNPSGECVEGSSLKRQKREAMGEIEEHVAEFGTKAEE